MTRGGIPPKMRGMTNWASIVSELIDAHTRAELARLTGAGGATLFDLANGKSSEPRHALGVHLLALHAKLQRQKRKVA